MVTTRVRLEGLADRTLAGGDVVVAVVDPADDGDSRLVAVRAALERLGEGRDGQAGWQAVTLDGVTFLPARLRPGRARAEELRAAAATVVRRAPRTDPLVLLAPPAATASDDDLTALLEGALLGTYAYAPLAARAGQATQPARTIGVAGADPERVARLARRAGAYADATALARDLVNEPGGSLTPERFAEIAAEHAEAAGVELRALRGAELQAAQLAGLQAVSRGSHQPPLLLELRYRPPGARRRLALVGKGITFDSGGLQVKSAEGMRGMKADMAGAAAVLAATVHLPRLAPQVEVTATIPLTDNMSGPDATRPGDFIHYPDGTVVEVLSTDAEGRLVLADGLLRAAAERPDLVIDVATLTGACMVALGPDVAGLFSNHDGLAGLIARAAERCGEPVWRLPLVDAYERLIASDLVDIKNIGPREGGAITAALFLRRFVPDGLPWAHLDMSAPATADREHGTATIGATGFGARLLLEVVGEVARAWPDGATTAAEAPRPRHETATAGGA